jgi:hypothetical protein
MGKPTKPMVKTGDIRADEPERSVRKTGQDKVSEAIKTSIRPDPRKRP